MRNGCVSSFAVNFDRYATQDDGSCYLPGCTDSYSPRYHSLATVSDGSCMPPVRGCTSSAADNFNPNATLDDGSCVTVGCVHAMAAAYDEAATVDAGRCACAHAGWPWPCAPLPSVTPVKPRDAPKTAHPPHPRRVAEWLGEAAAALGLVGGRDYI